jgi:hypothetical protein
MWTGNVLLHVASGPMSSKYDKSVSESFSECDNVQSGKRVLAL